MDERLLIEAAQKDASRFADLYEANFHRVYAFVSRRVGNRQEAQDLTSEVFHRALANLISVVEAAGGSTPHIARMIIYVTDKQEYSRRKREVGERYRARMGKHFPAMVLVEVKGLLDDEAKVEIEGIAAL